MIFRQNLHAAPYAGGGKNPCDRAGTAGISGDETDRDVDLSDHQSAIIAGPLYSSSWIDVTTRATDSIDSETKFQVLPVHQDSGYPVYDRCTAGKPAHHLPDHSFPPYYTKS